MNAFSVRPLVALTLLAALLAAVPVQADPIFGRDQLKFAQEPMINTTIPANGAIGVYHGHDELSTLYSSAPVGSPVTDYSGIAMADDFADAFSSPVLHVKWWGSYLKNSQNPNAPINKFLIAFESDVPANQNPVGPFSTPGSVLSSQIVNRGVLAPGSGTFTEKLVLGLPAPNEDIYEYNAELHLGKEFFQKPETVYWLKIAALVDVDPNSSAPLVEWGWHNRDYTVLDPLAAAVTPPVAPGERDERIELGISYPTPVWHFQDDSVSAQTRITVDGLGAQHAGPRAAAELRSAALRRRARWAREASLHPTARFKPGIDAFSKDLAFHLYTYSVPEPSSCCLMILGLAGLVRRRR